MTPLNLHQNSNDPSATWIVQKYGGTSVGKFAIRISEEIVPYVFLSDLFSGCFSRETFCITSLTLRFVKLFIDGIWTNTV